MKIGVPKEIKAQESRVSMVPTTVSELVRRGHQPAIEAGAGQACGFSDESYARAGALVLPTAAAVFGFAELIVKVKEPQKSELAWLRPWHILFAYLHLAADRALTEGLLTTGCTAIAYETVSVAGKLPMLEPMSEVAGRMAVIYGAAMLAKHHDGSGVLLPGVPGVPAGKVVVVGGGTAGFNAAKVALGLGAEVTILDVNTERLRHLDQILPGVRTLYSTPEHLEQLLPDCDLVIGAVLVPGAAAPRLITRAMLRSMKPGSVLVDIAVDQGGCAETTRPTTHESPTYVEEGVVHYCVSNMPGAYARTSTEALSNATRPWTLLLADRGLTGACAARAELLSGVNCVNGTLTCRPVGDAHHLPAQDPRGVLGL